MADPNRNRSEFVIFHATDLRPEGGVAFEHSVALARDADAQLYSVHAATMEPGEETRPMPDATALLQRWGDEAGVRFESRTHECCEDPVDTLLDAMHDVMPDLLVVGTHQRTGLNAVMSGSVAEGLANNSTVPTLLLPVGKPGFVHGGHLQLRRVLIPVGTDDDFEAAVETVAGLMNRLRRTDLEFHLLHLGDDDLLEDTLTPEHEGWSWVRVQLPEGHLSERIEQYCIEHDIDLVAMPTHQQRGLLDVFLGTNTQQTLRRVPCAMLAIPIPQT
jgi:nucleotide-binding universal stress UspA family protein